MNNCLFDIEAGVFERVIAKRYFQKYNELKALEWLKTLQHAVLYAKDILLLNEAALGNEQGVQVQYFLEDWTDMTPILCRWKAKECIYCPLHLVLLLKR